ncbi:MAG: polyprenyl synthetase family protein [Patescibacteria group bacterium]|nr:polyprenyl synthetase family protein [Patescibacteria group bacterium]
MSTNDAIGLLRKYKQRLDPVLEKYFQKKLKQAKKIDPLSEKAVELIREFTISGGKRIRPAVMYYGYLAAGGEDDERIVEVSMSIEMTHSFLLIHDDIIDRDETRHGISTLHEAYKEIAKKFFPKTNASHFGNSMAMIAGDMAASMGSEIIFNADYKPEKIVKALDRLQHIIYVTIPGEMVDVVLGAQGRATEEDIIRMYEGKTARYTFEGPAHLGAVFAGAKDDVLKNFTDYSLPLGSAFQIRDDILGVFGDEKKLGKPVGSDIIEGKQTMLVVKALENATKVQEKRFRELFGKEDITFDEIDDFRKIIEDTGSLKIANDMSERFIKESLESLSKIDIKNDQAKMFFEGIAQYIIERQH